jgi:hypothetical protein
MIVLLWLIIMAARMGYADLQFTYADNYLLSWIDSDSISESGYKNALEAITLSNKLHPDNPKLIEILAVIQARAFYEGYAEISNLQLALENYNKSLTLRPIWPWAWSSKAYNKLALDEIDDDLWQSLVMLDKTGPYNVDAHLTIVDIGLIMVAMENEYSERAAQLAKVHYKLGMNNKQSASSMSDIITQQNAQEVVADW